MSALTITIDTATGADMADCAEVEVAAVLRRLADKVEAYVITPGDTFPVRDTNGGTVGSIEWADA